MRHPTTGLSEDDLSRLTGSSSSTASADHQCLSSSSSSSSVNASAHKDCCADSKLNPHQSPSKKNHNSKSSHLHITSNTRFSSTYLPEFINPLEWQKSRKRKERLDSSSSTTQDRKLQRSNSEEQVNAAAATSSGDTHKTTKGADVIRRVSSEDFKRTSYAAYEQDLKEPESSCSANKLAVDENDAAFANRQKKQSQPQQQQQQIEPLPVICRETLQSGPTRDMTRRYRSETSPARSQRHSPVRSSGRQRENDDSDCERRRNSERFCKSRAPSVRRVAGISKKSSGGNSAKYLRNDENVYKYDLSALKYERRGFISKKVTSSSGPSEKVSNDLNDNNLIDLHETKNNQPEAASKTSAGNEEAIASTSTSTSTPASGTKSTNNKIPVSSPQEALPWERPVPEDQMPVLSRRYAAVRPHPGDCIDQAAKLSKVMPYPQHYHKQSGAAQLLEDDMDYLDPIEAYRAFTSLENFSTRDVMQQIIPAMIAHQSPMERLQSVNKRIAALKKKLAQLEEVFEKRVGYRPSQAERLNDKFIRHVLGELSKLRKERHELKTDPLGMMGMRVAGGMNSAKKLESMRNTLSEIEENLSGKRQDNERSETLDSLSADQLMQEKTAVQHGLLYFESLYGRPTTKEERDTVRPLYDRYRQLKRLVARNLVISGSTGGSGAPELPTILENEAMIFVESTPPQHSSSNSTETSNSPSDSVPATASTNDSTITNTATAVDEADANLNELTLDQLWEHLDKAREEKKLLKRTIRDFESMFEEETGRKMLKSDRKAIEDTYAQYKEKKGKARLLEALIKKRIGR